MTPTLTKMGPEVILVAAAAAAQIPDASTTETSSTATQGRSKIIPNGSNALFMEVVTNGASPVFTLKSRERAEFRESLGTLTPVMLSFIVIIDLSSLPPRLKNAFVAGSLFLILSRLLGDVFSRVRTPFAGAMAYIRLHGAGLAHIIYPISLNFVEGGALLDFDNKTST